GGIPGPASGAPAREDEVAQGTGPGAQCTGSATAMGRRASSTAGTKRTGARTAMSARTSATVTG
ncbi:hypothetical protein SC660_08700, partial [Actinotignum timonense]|uniref:hypothetical protein n=1 Tax=Actinotignum timonense TaxID=1870995 RepID=UPI002A826F40